MSHRLHPRTSHKLNRSRQIHFTFDRKEIVGFLGDTVGSALAAQGQRIFSRSFKYHRPRGLLCASGRCPNCLVNVDGIPNVRACVIPVQEGMKVRSQHCWPSLQFDFLSAIDYLGFLLPVGFYYKTFQRPRWMWKVVEPLIRSMAGLGALPVSSPETHYQHRYLFTEVAVIGGGPAGMAAASAAAEAGAQVTLIDDQRELGGSLRWTPDQEERLSALIENVHQHSSLKVLSNALAFGAYEGGLIGVQQDHTLIHLRAEKMIVATGQQEYPEVFENNDLPGIMLASGVRRMMSLYDVAPGSHAVILTRYDDGIRLAAELADRGISVAAVVDQRSSADRSAILHTLNKRAIRYLPQNSIVRAQGRKRVRGVTLTSGERIKCDLVCMGTHVASFDGLLRQAGLGSEGVFAIGGINGTRELADLIEEARGVGRQAAGDAAVTQKTRLDQNESGLGAPVATQMGSRAFICLCEDVTWPDLRQAVREGFDEVETLKRYTTFSMGPCQGHMCTRNARAVCADQTGKTFETTLSPTARPPVGPISLGVLAGPHQHPYKLTAMHYEHVHAGAQELFMGIWKRPMTYTSTEDEWRAVRERVGVIDLSTLGKLDLKGKDAGTFLDWVYTGRFSNLKTGRTRYGILCGEDGTVLDDGTVSRLADDHFFITTTTGNVEFVEGWYKWWQAGSDLCVHLTNVTGDYASINVAGPRAREVLQKLTALDLSGENFRYMMCRQGTVAGVPAILLRIGFVGETGWELHYPASYGVYLWRTILEAGSEFEIQPFGVETQRVLRLEKKHMIVGQDTDALSNPFEVDLSWTVKLEKPDFVGKKTLSALASEDPRQLLVGFEGEARAALPEGSAIVLNGKPVGRVCSLKVSPHLGKCIGMAVVPASLAQPGTMIDAYAEGKRVSLRVVEGPFYDPEGERLRS